MKTLSVVFATLCLAFGTWAAEHPKPCESPALLDGSFSLSTAERTTMGRFTYDALGQQVRLRSFAMDYNGNVTAAVSKDVLMTFYEGVAYEIDYSKWSCKKQKLNSEFSPMAVPKHAAFNGQVVIGSSSSPGMGMLVDNWNGLIFLKDGIGYHQSTFSSFGCLPLSSSFYTPKTQWAAISFYNVMIGIMNPMDFIVPGICKKAELESEETNFVDALQAMARES